MSEIERSQTQAHQYLTSNDQSDSHLKEHLLGSDQFGNPPWRHSLPYMLVVALFAFLSGFHLGIINEILESIAKDLHFNGSTLAEGLVASISFASAIVGCLFSGWLANKIGRRRGFQLCALTMIIGASTSAIAKGLWYMVLGRLLVGIALGISPTLSSLYVTEISPAYIRGTFGSFMGFSTCLGFMMSLCIGIPTKDILGWWRVCFWVSNVPAVAVAFLMEFCVESPHWLFKKGRAVEAKVAFQKLLGEGMHVEAAMTEMSESVRGQKSDTIPFSELFHGQNFKAIYIGFTLYTFQQLSGIHAASYFSSIVFKTYGVESNLANVFVGVSSLTGSLTATILMDKLGRKLMLLWSYFGMAIALGLQVMATSSFISSSWESYLSVGGMLMFALMFAIGAGPIPGLLLPEILPSRIRAKAIAICMTGYLVLNFLVGLLFLRLLEQIGMQILNTIFGSFCIGAMVFVKRNIMETKGKTLQEIETALASPE